MNQNPSESSELPDLFLMLHEAAPTEIDSSFRQKFDSIDIKIAVERHPGGPYAGIELYLPTAIALFIAAGFSTAFSKKQERTPTLR